MHLIDTHAHLTSDALYGEVEALLQRGREVGLEKVVNICTDATTLERGLALRERFPWVYNTAATTPHDVVEEGEAFFPKVAEAAGRGQLVALGETGLDYYYEHSDRGVQRAFLLRYFELAKESGLPLIFHCREAFCDLFELADMHYKGGAAILHCFTGTLEEAKGVLDRGWLVSMSGIVTFKKSLSLQEVARYVPLDRLVIETDAPYLAPQSHRGMQNEPSFVVETARFLAELKGVSVEVLAEATRQNAVDFFSF